MYRIGAFLLLIGVVSAGKNDIYAGYSVHGVKLRDQSDQTVVYGLQNMVGADIWSYGYPDERDATIMLSPENREAALDELNVNGIEHYVKFSDVTEILDNHDREVLEWRKRGARRGGRAAIPFDVYPRYAEVDSYLEGIAAQYPNLVKIVNAGPSFENRPIKYLKISTSNFEDSNKPIYFMQAMLHSREWVTTPVALYSIHRLVEDLREQDKDLLEDIDWIILPLVNPDGYEYSHLEDRMWRRTRSYRPDVSTECWGADGNRNFDANWNTTSGVSTDPCNNQYTGPEAFSELETKIVRDILLEHVDRMQIFMDIHSFGNWVLFGYGNRTLPSAPNNPINLFHVGSAMGAAIDVNKLPTSDYYKVGNSANLLYETSGSSNDYAMLIGVPMAYCLELPDYGHMFMVPPSYIDQINTETWEGIAVSARLAKLHYKLIGVPMAYCLELPDYGHMFMVPPSYIEQINTETWEGIAVSARLAKLHYKARLSGL